MAFYVSWTPPAFGMVIRRFGSEEAAMEFVRDLVARTAVPVEFGSLLEGRQFPILSGDELRRACSAGRSSAA